MAHHGIGWGDIRALLYAQQDGRCHWCHRHVKFERSTTDHVKPRSSGGSRRDSENLVMACRECNLRKGDSDPASFASNPEVARREICERASERNARDNAEMKEVWRDWSRENMEPQR